VVLERDSGGGSGRVDLGRRRLAGLDREETPILDLLVHGLESHHPGTTVN
jgi:hypothetical protein